MSDKQIDQLIDELAKPIFTYRLARGRSCNSDVHSAMAKGAETVMSESARQIRDIVRKFDQEN